MNSHASMLFDASHITAIAIPCHLCSFMRACFSQGLLQHGTALIDILVRLLNVKDPHDPLCNAILPQPNQHPGMYLCAFRLYAQQGSEPDHCVGSLSCLLLVPFNARTADTVPAVPTGAMENDKGVRKLMRPRSSVLSPPVHAASLMQPCWVGLACFCVGVHQPAFPSRLHRLHEYIYMVCIWTLHAECERSIRPLVHEREG